MKKFLQGFWYDEEYRTYLFLIVLSAVTALVDFRGSSGSATMAMVGVHMLFHTTLFVGAFTITVLRRRGYRDEQTYGTIDRWVSIGAIAIIVGYSAYRCYALFGLNLDFAFEDKTRFQWSCVVSLILLATQWYILHGTKQWTCHAACHVMEGHVGLDAIGLIVLLVPTLLGGFIGGIAVWYLDAVCFVGSLVIMGLTVRKIYQGIKPKQHLRIVR